VDLGFPHDLVLWYTGLGIVASAAGVVALRIVPDRGHAGHRGRPAGRHRRPGHPGAGASARLAADQAG